MDTITRPQTPASMQNTQQTPSKTTDFIVVGITILLLLVSAGFGYKLYQLNRQRSEAPAPTPTPLVPTPTPVRRPSKFATDSAFLNLETTVASLSAVVAGYQIDDSTLTPPTPQIPLGFSN